MAITILGWITGMACAMTLIQLPLLFFEVVRFRRSQHFDVSKR
jgi:hypothetical protein